MFEALLVGTVMVAVMGMICAFDGSRDVFHPLMLTCPMFIFLYGWMPFRLHEQGYLAWFFQDEQLIFVQTLNLLGVAAFVLGCLGAGCRLHNPENQPAGRRLLGHIQGIPANAVPRLLVAASFLGGIGVAAWLVTIVNAGGFVNAFSRAYGGGWDDSGYIRDSAILMLAGSSLVMVVIARNGMKFVYGVLLAFCATPWLVQAILTSRRGPTFTFITVLSLSWYLSRGRRPAILSTLITGLLVGYLVLFLVSNRGSIFIGSERELTTDVTGMVEKPDTGNEYIYGTGAVLAAERLGKHFWLRRYAAQVLVRPIPSAIWPNKYEDFGVPELLQNAGTGEGIADTLGWVGAVGSAPGIVADLWIELRWLSLAFMALLGWVYGKVWQRALLLGRGWLTQYVVFAALTIYLVMQTMEAVIFRCLLLSIPLWLAWRWALQVPVPARLQWIAMPTLPDAKKR